MILESHPVDFSDSEEDDAEIVDQEEDGEKVLVADHEEDEEKVLVTKVSQIHISPEVV